MNKKIAMKWVEALRSGKYKQGIGFLNRENKFCCLGVLCEISKLKKTSFLDKIYGYGDDGYETVLPNELQKKLKINAWGNSFG